MRGGSSTVRWSGSGWAPDSFVVEVASNDGYLLQHVVERGIRCLGIEPSVQRRRGGPGEGCADADRVPDARRPARRCAPSTGRPISSALNNVYAHIPDVVGFTAGPAVAGRGRRLGVDRGAAPAHAGGAHPVRHDLPRALPVLHGADRAAGARLAAASRWSTSSCSTPTAGRSGCGPGPPRWRASRRRRVRDVLAAEAAAGLHTAAGHDGFAAAVSRVRDDLVAFLIEARRAGKTVVGYGAPGKGNTLLNYCGIRPDLLAYTVDRNPYKHGRFTPGTRIPVLPPERIAADRPDYVLVLPWNLRTELTEQLVLRPGVGRPARLPDPDPRGGLSRVDEGRSVLRRVRHADARRRVGPAQADAPGRPASADLACDALLRAFRAQGVRAVPGLRRAPHQGLLPELRRDRVATTSCCAAATSSCWAATSRTGRSPSRTPGWTRRSASGCAGCASTSRARRCSWPTTPTCSPTRRWTR